jgi:excisionase family DNA binding protein
VILTPKEAAERVKLCPETIRRKCQSGEIEAYKPAGEWRIEEEALMAWLESTKPRQDPGVFRPERKMATTSSFGRRLEAINGIREVA